MIVLQIKTKEPAPAVGYRSGVAARLAGLPVETLRVWERRYGVCDTRRSAHGQRLYSEAQVGRLSLIKQLVDHGHPIGSLAQLELDQLRAMAPASRAPSRPLRLALVGQALALRLSGSGSGLAGLDIVGKCRELDGAAAALAGSSAEVLLIEVAELEDSALPVIVALREQLGAAIVVLYRFCASATIRHLREQGCLVARAPADAAEIVLLCQAALAAVVGQAEQVGQADLPQHAPSAARRFDDEALSALAAASNSVACECPRHLCDILLMLNSFERYSLQCASRTPADALLHEQLGIAAGSARVLLEAALEQLALADGLPLPAAL